MIKSNIKNSLLTIRILSWTNITKLILYLCIDQVAWPWGLPPWINILLIASSFSSMKSTKLYMDWENRELHELEEDKGEGGTACCFLYRTNWRTTLSRKMRSAVRLKTPHSRYRPQKLIKWSWLGSDSRFFSPGQPILQNHFSWIFRSSPLSESFKIAVDMSIARGESLWKA